MKDVVAQRGMAKNGPIVRYLLREVKQAARAAEAERRDAQQGHAHTGDEKAGDGGPDMTAGLLPHVDGEDQVSGAEEHTK